MKAALTLQSVQGARGGKLLFADLNLALPSGGVLAVTGANGVGKTSLLRLIAGLLPQLAGQIVISDKGCELVACEDRMRAVAWLGAADGVKRRLTVRENVLLMAKLFGGGTKIVTTALARCQLEGLASRLCATLSTGQRKRVALAQMLAMARPLWLLDEPMAALDAPGRALLEELLQAHAAAGGVAVVASHDAVAAANCHLHLTGAS